MRPMLTIAVAGCPLTTPKPGGTVEGLKRAHALGIRGMEIEWVQNVPSDPKRMAEIRATAEGLSMQLTVHAPYYVNLNSPDPEKLSAGIGRVLKALSMAELAGAVSVCVHPAFYLGMPPEKAFGNVRRAVDRILREKAAHFPHVNMGLETMGKPSQFGTLEELLRISKEFDLYPCVDSAHMHARFAGAWNTPEEWHTLLDLYEEALGKKSLQHMHLHYSGIDYGKSGEKKHLPFRESDARWKDFLAVLKERKVGGQLVCESPLMEEDTLLLQNTYATL